MLTRTRLRYPYAFQPATTVPTVKAQNTCIVLIYGIFKYRFCSDVSQLNLFLYSPPPTTQELHIAVIFQQLHIAVVVRGG